MKKAAEFMSKGKFAEKKEEGAPDQNKSPDITWNIGDIEYEAYMRMLDAAVSFLISRFDHIPLQSAVIMFLLHVPGTGLSNRLSVSSANLSQDPGLVRDRIKITGFGAHTCMFCFQFWRRFGLGQFT